MVPAQKFGIFIGICIYALSYAPSASAVFTPSATESARMNVSLRVNPKPHHFQFLFGSDLVNSTAGADREITYTITYGSQIDYSTPMVITASWSLGTVPEEHLTNYDIVSYVAGSATKDYWGQSTPIVDVKRRTITWIIRRFPPNTIDKTLTFKLKTPGRYVTDRQVHFTVNATMRTEQIDVGTLTLDQIYNPSEFIRTEVAGLRILSADIRKITDTSFSLFLVTSEPAKTVIYYGIDPNDLNKEFSDDVFADQKILTVDGLLPATTYYFKILIENDKGIQRKTPELFVVTTASHSILSRIDLDRMMATSKGVSVRRGYDTEGHISLLAPAAKAVDIYLPFVDRVPPIAYLSVGQRNVLGIATEPIPDITKIRLLETEPGVITGRFSTPLEPGQYDLVFEAQNAEGTINQDILASMSVSPSVTVIDERGNPIEKALVYIERFNTFTGSFESFPAQSYGAKNPDWTGTDGSIDMVLPLGEYMINVNALGFEPDQRRFLLTVSGHSVYPTINLKREPFNIIHWFAYYRAVFDDFLSFVRDIVRETGSSYRFLDLSFFVGMVILTALSLLSNLHRIRLSLEGLYILIERKIRKALIGRAANRLFIGFIEDKENEMPLYHAICYLVRLDTNTVAAKDMTSAMGEFHLPMEPGHKYALVVKKPGYTAIRIEIDITVLFDTIPAIQMERETPIRLPEQLQFVEVLISTVIHGLSDSFVVGVAIFNILLCAYFGFPKMLPIVFVTALNLYLWLQFHWAKFKSRLK